MKYDVYSNLKQIFLSIVWLSFFFSINLNPMEFSNFSILNKIRILMPSVLILCSIILIKNICYKNLIQKESIIFLIIFVLYFIFNILYEENHLANLFWPIYMFLAYFFITSITNANERKKLIKFTIFILLIAFTFYFSLALIEMIRQKNPNFYGILGNDASYSGIKNPPRSSGLARMAIILFSYYLLYYLIKKSENNNYYKIFIMVFIFATITNIFQARTISFIFVVVNLIFIFFYFKKIFLNKKILIFALILPLIFNSGYNYLKYNYFAKKNIGNDTFVTYDLKLNLLGHVLKNSIVRDQKPDSNGYGDFSSGRFYNWNKALKIIQREPLIGYGTQSDRIFLEQSIHNALIYAFLSGGLIAAICFFLIYLRALFFFIKFITIKKLRLNFHFSLCLVLIIIFCLRSVLETSFAIFSLDYLIFILAFSYLSNFVNKKNHV